MAAEDKVDVYMPLYVRDFLTATIGWSAEERGHYLTLLMVQWDRGGLPADLSLLERLSPGVSAVWQVLTDKFPQGDDGQRRNTKLEQHRGKAIELRRKRANAGKIGNEARWSESDCDADAIANGSQTDRNAIANGSHPPSPPPSPSNAVISSDEEIIQPAAPVVATSDPPKRRKRSQHRNAVFWSEADGWQGISDADRTAWATAYPATVLDIELARATEWLKANITRAKKSNWRRFVVSWLSRSQDRGGTNRTPGKSGDEAAKRASLERKAREFAEYVPSTYRTPKEVAGLAANLKLKDEATA